VFVFAFVFVFAVPHCTLRLAFTVMVMNNLNLEYKGNLQSGEAHTGQLSSKQAGFMNSQWQMAKWLIF
jgi:hypothetical protein